MLRIALSGLALVLLAACAGPSTQPGDERGGPLPSLAKPAQELDLPPPPGSAAARKKLGLAKTWLLPISSRTQPPLAAEVAKAFRQSASGQPGLASGAFREELPDPRTAAGSVRLAQMGAQYVVTGAVDVGRGGMLNLELYAPPDATPRWVSSVPVATEQELAPAVKVILGRLTEQLEQSHSHVQLSFGPQEQDAATDHAWSELFGGKAPARTLAAIGSGEEPAPVEEGPPPVVEGTLAPPPAPPPEVELAPPRGKAPKTPAAAKAPAAAKGGKPVADRPAGKKGGKAEAGGRYSHAVQVGSFQDPLNAEKQVAVLRKQGQEPYLLSYRRDGKVWYSVRLGRFGSKPAAEEFLNKYRKGHPKDNVSVVPYQP